MARFQILVLDGGGIRGLYSAAVLAKLEDKLGVRIVEHFDLITGTSTGGIIALGLGLGMLPREIVRFYVEAGPRIFSNRFRWRDCIHIVRRKYSGSALQAALNYNGAFGDKKLGDSKKRLVIPAYNLGQDKVRVFKTPHHKRLTTDWQIPAWKVAMATSANWLELFNCPDFTLSDIVDVLASVVLPSPEHKQRFLAEPCVAARATCLCNTLRAIAAELQRRGGRASTPRNWPPTICNN
jgi:hypothetical protein